MNGELATLVALASHGSAFLAQGTDAAPPELFPSASAFRFTNTLEFHRHTRRLGVSTTDLLVGRACTPWYADLRQRGATSIRLGQQQTRQQADARSQHIAAGFSGGLDAAMMTRFADGHRELWSGRWDVTEGKHPEQRIWSVEFHGVETKGSLYEGPDLDAATRRLGDVLQAAESLARRADYENWARIFRDAAQTLSAASPLIPYHSDLLPAGRSGGQPGRLLAAAGTAWVFGGMGSWNDVGIDDADYDRVTTELYAAVLEAIFAAANAT